MRHNSLVKKQHPFERLLRDVWDIEPFQKEGSIEQNHVSLSEDETHVYVEASLPGLDKSEIEVTLERGILWIRGEKEEKTADSKRKYHYRAHRNFSYKVYIPESVNDSKEAIAEYNNGVLHITFEKKQEKEPKKISIRTK